MPKPAGPMIFTVWNGADALPFGWLRRWHAGQAERDSRKLPDADMSGTAIPDCGRPREDERTSGSRIPPRH